MAVLKVATEVWMNVAQLQKENPDASFTMEEIVSRVKENNYYGEFRNGIITHISQHCVADKHPNPSTFSMLISDGPGGHSRRLLRDSDLSKIKPGRNKLQRVPLLNEVPEKLLETCAALLGWWGDQEGVTLYTPQSLPLTKAERMNQIRLSTDIYPFLREHEPGLIDAVKNFEIIDRDAYGNPSNRFLNRPTMVKVGFALTQLRIMDLIDQFENDYLSPHRTIKNSYETWYFEHELVVKSINNSKEPIPAGLMEAPSTPSAAPSHSLSRVNEDNYIVINLDNHLCKFLREQGFESDASNIKEFQISEYADSEYTERSVTVQIGRGIACIKQLGLFEEFEYYISSRVHPRYSEWYEKYTVHLGLITQLL